jgi:hypothetical protein
VETGVTAACVEQAAETSKTNNKLIDKTFERIK